MTVPVTFEFGIIIRRAALSERNVSLRDVLSAMESLSPSGEDRGLLAFGPHFGQEAADELIRRLKELGLEYVDDFFDLFVDHPRWLKFYASLANEDAG